ncbi:paramyosin-like isoform X2 [Drosophila montana]
MENRSAVGLEFQFQTHKTKSKLRENELLSVLSEKEEAIVNLEKTLKELSKDVLRNSKEDQMRSMCPELETSCERICDKCIDLERLLQEYKNAAPNGDAAQSIDCKCEQLRSEIANTRAQLESVQNAYKQMTSDMAEKSELYDRLSRDVISAEEAKGLLQEKCDDLENAQQRHDQIIQSMQAEYDAIQEKYQKLQQDYETLERTSAATEEQHKKLQSQNVSLQQEITTLKESFEQIQQTLMQTTNSDSSAKATIVEQLKAHNEELMENLAQLEAKYGEMQREYEDLSNQLIESMQDGDSLRDQCSALQEELQQQQVAAKSAEENEQRTQQLLAHIARLESEVAEKNTLIDATEGTINEMREQMTNLESALLEKSVIVNKVEDYQRQIESLEKQHAEMTMVCEELQEKVKENTINESLLMSNSTQTLMSDDSVPQQEIEALKTRLSDLNAELNGLHAQIQQKDDLIEKIQSELQELNERCISMDVLQVELQANARQNQQLLDRQASKLTDDANRIDKLQESNAQLLERSIKAEEMVEIFKQRLSLAAEVECSKDQYEKRLNDMQIALDNAKKEFELKEKENKDHLDNVKLEYLQKIEISETEYRGNMRKYNIEWEESKDRYETTLEKLQKQLSSSEERCNKLCAENESDLLSVKAANEQLVKEKHELESLYDESQKLVQQIQAKLCIKQKDEEKDREMVTSSNHNFQELLKKYEMQMHEYEELKSKHQLSLDSLKQEKSSLQFDVDESKLTIKRLTNDLQAEQQKWQQQASLAQQLGVELEANAAEKAEYLEKVETLNNKIEDLAEKLKQATLKAVDFDKLVVEHTQVKLLLSESNDLNENLSQKVQNLESELLQAQTELTTQRDILQRLQSELETTLLLKSNACSEQSSLTDKLRELEATICEQANQFEHKLKELQCSKNELQLKLDSLLTQKVELETTNHKLTVKLKNVLNLQNLLEKEREHNAQLQKSNAELQSKIEDKETTSDTLSEALQQQKIASAQLEDRLAAATTEANRNADELRSQIETLQKEVDKLCSVVKTNKANFDAERIRLDGTISSLLEDKRNLEEKLCTTNEILKKVETDLRNSNNSFESNASNTSPITRKSLDRDPNQPRKSLSLESEVRRNRRISTHDERRRQSYWNDSRHVSCMTDPVDNNCNCAVLDRKLQDCQRELFIRESMVTALNIELKNHPLKEETAILKRRLQEEQAKARDEIKRLKQKNIDLMNKVHTYTASAAISASAHPATTVSAKQTTVETQTDSNLETIVRKTNEKYNDCLQLCRHRYNKIRDLEERLKQNENNDTSNISSQTAGQISALKSQLESQKKEILTLTNKYEFAKRALKMRRDENNELRQVAGTDVPASSK